MAAPKPKPTPKAPPKEDLKEDAIDPTDSEPDTPSDDGEGVATPETPTTEEVVVEAPKPRTVSERIKDIETRHGKGIQEVLIDIHDHVFGTSRPHEEVTAEPK